MPEIFTLQQSDDLSSVVERIRQSSADEVAVLIPKERHAFINPVTLRLLQKFSGEAGKATKIISNDPRIQDLSREAGFTVFATIHAYHDGVEAAAHPLAIAERENEDDVHPHLSPDAATQTLAASSAAGLVSSNFGAGGDRGSVAVVRAGRVTKTDPSWFRTTAGKMTIGGVIVSILLILLIVVVPGASVTVHLQGNQLTYQSELTGSPANAGAIGTFQTIPVVAQESKTFQGNPTGTTGINGSAAQGYVQISSSLNLSDLVNCNSSAVPASEQATCVSEENSVNASGSYYFLLQSNTVFSTGVNPAQSLDFSTSQSYCVTFSPITNATPNTQLPANGVVQAYSASTGCTGANLPGVPVQDSQQETAGNVSPASITQWQDNPCSPAFLQQQATNPTYFSPFTCPNSGSPFGIGNDTAFVGGKTPTQVPAVTQADLTSFQSSISSLEATETSDLKQQAQGKLNGRTLALDLSGNGLTYTFTVSPAIPTTPKTPWNPTTVTVTGTVNGISFSGAAIKAAVVTALKSQAPPHTTYAPSSLKYEVPVVTEVSGSSIYISVNATAYSVRNLPVNLNEQISGHSPGSLTGYLQQQIGAEVQSVGVSQHPYPMPMLPLLSSHISISEKFSCTSSCSGSGA